MLYAAVKLEVLTNWEVLRKIDTASQEVDSMNSYVAVDALTEGSSRKQLVNN
jgi:hypothetical protein